MRQLKLGFPGWACAALLFALAAGNAAQDKNTMRPSSSDGDADAAGTTSKNPVQFEAAPGIPLPGRGMVWILDQGENGPELNRIYLNIVHVNGHTAENFVKAQFLVLPMGATFELPDPAAKLRVRNHTPVIFYRISTEEDEELKSAQPAANRQGLAVHYVLLRVKVDGNRRIPYTYVSWQLGIKRARREDDVDVLTEEVDNVRWMKIIPSQPLPNGEYAVVRMPDNKKYYESNAYDFGVGPAGVHLLSHSARPRHPPRSGALVPESQSGTAIPRTDTLSQRWERHLC